MSRRVTSQDVADLAGVSRTTVSFVLNNVHRFSIRPETAEKVRLAARELGYYPNASAKALELDSAKGGILNKVKRIAPLIIPVTMNAIVSSEDIANAMDLRGFGQQKRTWLYELKYHWWDYAVIGFSVLLLGVILFLAYGHGMRLFDVPQWWYGLFN